MIFYSFSTLMSSILTSTLLLLLTCIICSNTRCLLRLGHRFLIFLTFLIIFRLTAAIEFPFTRNVGLDGALSSLLSDFQHVYGSYYGLELSLWTVFLIIWLAGVILLSFRYISAFRKTYAYIRRHGINKTDSPTYQKYLAEICSSHHKTNHFLIWELSGLPCPMIFSLSRPCILLPSDYPLTDEELYIILSHETAHYFNHDLLTKFLINLLCICFWWNPFCLLIKRQTSALLEIQIDHILTGRDPQKIRQYLSCLYKIKKESCQVHGTALWHKDTALSLLHVKKSLLEQRFQILVSSQKKYSKAFQFILLAAFTSIYLSSYFFIFEANETPPAEENGTLVFQLSPENTYFVQNEHGTYDIYFNGIYIETVDSIEYYSNSIPVYHEDE